MSFTDQLPRIATADDVAAPWGGHPKNFRCGFCGHKFEIGDQWRWVYTNDVHGAGGNPFVCKDCDAPRDELITRWKAMYKEHKRRSDKFGWFNRR